MIGVVQCAKKDIIINGHGALNARQIAKNVPGPMHVPNARMDIC